MARKSGSSTAKQVKKKYCSACQQEKRDGLFYVSYNPLHSDGRMPICKECIRNACYDDDGEFNIDNLYSILRQLDRPFLQDIWESSVNEVCKNLGTQEVSYDPIIGKYIKNISIQQHRAKLGQIVVLNQSKTLIIVWKVPDENLWVLIRYII